MTEWGRRSVKARRVRRSLQERSGASTALAQPRHWSTCRPLACFGIVNGLAAWSTARAKPVIIGRADRTQSRRWWPECTPTVALEAGKRRKFLSLDQRLMLMLLGVREEISLPGKSNYEWARRPGSGLLQRVVRVHADGPLVKAHLTVFGAKLAMALYREHVGVALPLDGAIWCQFALSGGMTHENLSARVEKLPLQETLRQGTKNVGEQFAYRFNCDERTVIAAVVQFHRGLWFTVFASSDQKIVELFSKPEHLKLPASALVKPGHLLTLLPVPTVASA